MKVLLLMSTRGLFGAENAVLELSKQLPLYGFEPHIGIIDDPRHSPSSLQEEAERNNLLVKIFPCRIKFDLSTVFEIRKFMKQNQILLLHSQGYKSNFYSILSGINTKIRKISTCHNWLSNGVKMKYYENLDKLLLNNFDRIVAVSDILKEEILLNRVPKEKVTVINNGIDIERFNSLAAASKMQLKETLGVKESEKIIGAVGRLSIEKGHLYLLEAFAKVAPEFPGVKLLIVGDGQLKNELEDISYKLQLKDRAIFTGIRQDIPELLNIMDIFVLPSLTEGLPMALLEAMAAKTPVIASRVGGVPGVIENQKTGILIEPRDANAIANSIRFLLKDDGMKKTIAINAFERVKNEFSSSSMAQNYLKIYKEVLGCKRLN